MVSLVTTIRRVRCGLPVASGRSASGFLVAILLAMAPIHAKASPFTILEFDNRAFANDYVYWARVWDEGPNYYGWSDLPPHPDDAVALLHLPFKLRPDAAYDLDTYWDHDAAHMTFESGSETFGLSGWFSFAFTTDAGGQVASWSSRADIGSGVDVFRWEHGHGRSWYYGDYEWFDMTCPSANSGSWWDLERCLRFAGGSGRMNGTWSVVATSSIPLPASSLLLLSGLAVAASLGVRGRRGNP
jgi:hypothetical protein